MPGLNMAGAHASSKASDKDEVAEILKGLQLDKQFFLKRLSATPYTKLAQLDVSTDGETSPQSPSESRIRTRQQTKLTTKKYLAAGEKKKFSDFDLYLGEAVMPVLAQALDSLCRQLDRLDKPGDRHDCYVRARFNPLTWVAQQLLRSHPKNIKTPRRQTIYRSFTLWSDLEKGRREMLQRKDLVQQIFDGFMRRGFVQFDTALHVLDAIDDTLKLNGILKGNSNMQAALRQPESLQGDGLTFEYFWHAFANAIMRHEVVPYSAIEAGVKLQQQEIVVRAQREETKCKDDETRRANEDKQRTLIAAYSDLLEQINNDECLTSIITEGKILSGDNLKPDDPGAEFELPHIGKHVQLIGSLLVQLGFDDLPKVDGESCWTAEMAKAWMVVQKVHNCELCDGVLEGKTLEQVLVPPVEFLILREKIEHELASQGDRTMSDSIITETTDATKTHKPSMVELAQDLGFSVTRIHWLHQLFVSFLPPDRKDLYPDSPAKMPKLQMRKLIREVKPQIEDDEFVARFPRIDHEDVGTIEFDEFCAWVREDEVRIGGIGKKMTVDELAAVYNKTPQFIHYLHRCFQSHFPEGASDDDPETPALLPKAACRQLIEMLTPSMSDPDFETAYAVATSGIKGGLEFDEFLEVLNHEEAHIHAMNMGALEH